MLNIDFIKMPGFGKDFVILNQIIHNIKISKDMRMIHGPIWCNIFLTLRRQIVTESVAKNARAVPLCIGFFGHFFSLLSKSVKGLKNIGIW